MNATAARSLPAFPPPPAGLPASPPPEALARLADKVARGEVHNGSLDGAPSPAQLAQFAQSAQSAQLAAAGIQAPTDAAAGAAACGGGHGKGTTDVGGANGPGGKVEQAPQGTGEPAGGAASNVAGASGPGGKVEQTGGPAAVKAGGPAAPAAISHTSDHGTVLAASSTSLTLRDDAGVTQTFQIRPQDLANIDLPHLLEKHVKTGKTLDLVFAEVNGVKYATGYSHPPAAPTNPPAPPSKIPHGAIHGTVAGLTDTKLSLRDDNGVVTDYAITDANRAALDLEHLRSKHVPTGKALNLVFTEKDGVRQAISYNHPAAPPAPAPAPTPAR